MSGRVSFTYENSGRARYGCGCQGDMISENFEFITEKMVPNNSPGAPKAGIAADGGRAAIGACSMAAAS